MSLWTPDGERPIPKTPPTPTQAPGPSTADSATQPPPELRAALAEAGIDLDSLTPEQVQEATQMLAEMGRVRQEMLSVPAAEIVANHLMGFYELAAIHLGENPPNFPEATVAIEALGAVLDRLGSEFGENESVLRQALSQLQLTFVQLTKQATGEPDSDEAVSPDR